MSPFRRYQFNARGMAHSRRSRWRRLWRHFEWRSYAGQHIYLARSRWGMKW